MSIADWGAIGSGALPDGFPTRSTPQRPLHRLAAVRRRQNVSQRNVARHLGIDMATVKQQEQETTDITLSTLYRWQSVLQVPIAEMLVDNDEPLSPPVMARAQLVKLMKTAVALLDKADNSSTRRLAQMLIDQLLEIMPELKDVGPWHSIGQRRTLDEYGRAAHRVMPDELLGGH